MVKVISIDPGLDLGLVMLDDDRVTYSERVGLKKWQHPQRLVNIGPLLIEHLTNTAFHREYGSPDVIGIEDQHVGRVNLQSAIKLAQLTGAIYSALARVCANLYLVQPSEAKAALTGKGNASKELMQQFASATYGLVDPPEAVADALGVAIAAREAHRIARLTQAE